MHSRPRALTPLAEPDFKRRRVDDHCNTPRNLVGTQQVCDTPANRPHSPPLVNSTDTANVSCSAPLHGSEASDSPRWADMPVDVCIHMLSFITVPEVIQILPTCSGVARAGKFLLNRAEEYKIANLDQPSMESFALLCSNLVSLSLTTCVLEPMDLHLGLSVLSDSLKHLSVSMCVVNGDLEATRHIKAPVMNALESVDIFPVSFLWGDGLFVNAPSLCEFSCAKTAQEHTCANCGIRRGGFKCANCLFYGFCSSECQLMEWNQSPGHRLICGATGSFNVKENPINHIQPNVWMPPLLATSKHLMQLQVSHCWHQPTGRPNQQSPHRQTLNSSPLELCNAYPLYYTNSIHGHFATFAALAQTNVADTTQPHALDMALLHAMGTTQNHAMGTTQNHATEITNPNTPPPANVHAARNAHKDAMMVIPRPVNDNCLTRLRCIRMVRCGLDDRSIEWIAKTTPYLEELDVSWNTQITCRGIEHLNPQSSPFLHIVKLRQCHRLCQVAISTIARKFRNLTCLDARAGYTLRRSDSQLHLRVVWGLTYETVSEILERCENLRTFHLIAQESVGPLARVGIVVDEVQQLLNHSCKGKAAADSSSPVEYRIHTAIHLMNQYIDTKREF